jgi:hypothetical protein
MSGGGTIPIGGTCTLVPGVQDCALDDRGCAICYLSGAGMTGKCGVACNPLGSNTCPTGTCHFTAGTSTGFCGVGFCE